MPVIAAGVVTKTGRILVARCFMDVTRIRIEGLLSAFPKLLGSGTNKQTTFIDSGNVRYLYQPVEGMYLVTVTTKASNIMEDLATLRLLGRVIPEYCNPITEDTVVDKAFEIMFAMDEIVTNGAREASTMDQVMTALEMRSEAEERAQREQQEKEKAAKKVAKAKAKEMKQRRMEHEFSGGGGGGMGSSYDAPDTSASTSHAARFSEVASTEPAEAKPAPKKLGGGGMSLSNKRKQDQAARVLAETGGVAAKAPAPQPVPAAAAPVMNEHAINVRIEERISVSLNREGGLNGVDIKGDMNIMVTDPAAALVRIHLSPLNPEFTFKTHPNINKNMFASDNMLVIKDSRPYPVNQSLGILRWRAQALQKMPVPLSITCWPSDSGATIEFELENTELVLEDVVVNLPLAGNFPQVAEISQGEFAHDQASSVLQWRIGRIDGNEPNGSLEVQFENASNVDQAFFPASVSFSSATSLATVAVRDVVHVESAQSVEFGCSVVAVTDDYTIN